MTTLTLQPDAAAGIDTTVLSTDADTNYGTNTGLWVSTTRHALLKFNLTSIPAGSTIVSATLSLWKIAPYVSGDQICNVYRVLAANSAWTEAGATWNYAVASTTRWAGDAGGDGGADAGCSISGVDYSATSMGTWTFVSFEEPGTLHAIALSTAEMAAMVASNNGFVLIGATTRVPAVMSSDGLTAGNRPKLVVDYTSGSPLLRHLQESGEFRGGTL